VGKEADKGRDAAWEEGEVRAEWVDLAKPDQVATVCAPRAATKLHTRLVGRVCKSCVPSVALHW